MRRGHGGTILSNGSVGRVAHWLLPPGHPARVVVVAMAGLLTRGSKLPRTFPGHAIIGPVASFGVALRSQLRGQSRIRRPCGSSSPCSLFIPQRFRSAGTISAQTICADANDQYGIYLIQRDLTDHSIAGAKTRTERVRHASFCRQASPCNKASASISTL
jgi:hypothetical protein